jgi:hypothetical protein
LDLLVGLGVGTLLIVVQAAGWANSKGQSRTIACLANLENMAQAWHGFAEDNAGVLVGNLDGGGVQTLSNSNKTWVLGFLDFSGGNSFPANAGGRANTNTLVLTQFSPLAPYLRGPQSFFKCPADPSLDHGITGAARVRSIAMNSYMGERAQPYTAGFRQFKRMTDMINPSPSQAFVFIDEREDSINDGWFAIDMSSSDPINPEAHRIINYPSDRHNWAGNLSFADGHGETWRWRDSRTMPPHRPGVLLAMGSLTPHNPDVARIQAATSSTNSP